MYIKKKKKKGSRKVEKYIDKISGVIGNRFDNMAGNK